MAKKTNTATAAIAPAYDPSTDTNIPNVGEYYRKNLNNPDAYAYDDIFSNDDRRAAIYSEIIGQNPDATRLAEGDEFLANADKYSNFQNNVIRVPGEDGLGSGLGYAHPSGPKAKTAPKPTNIADPSFGKGSRRFKGKVEDTYTVRDPGKKARNLSKEEYDKEFEAARQSGIVDKKGNNYSQAISQPDSPYYGKAEPEDRIAGREQFIQDNLNNLAEGGEVQDNFVELTLNPEAQATLPEDAVLKDGVYYTNDGQDLLAYDLESGKWHSDPIQGFRPTHRESAIRQARKRTMDAMDIPAPDVINPFNPFDPAQFFQKKKSGGKVQKKGKGGIIATIVDAVAGIGTGIVDSLNAGRVQDAKSAITDSTIATKQFADNADPSKTDLVKQLSGAQNTMANAGQGSVLDAAASGATGIISNINNQKNPGAPGAGGPGAGGQIDPNMASLTSDLTATAGAVSSGTGLINSLGSIKETKQLEEQAKGIANLQYKGIVDDGSASRFGYGKGGKVRKLGRKGYKKGGEISGPGTAKSDSIKGKLPEGTFVVPAENADIASDIGEQYLGWTKDEEATLNAKGEPVAVSDGEVLFTPQEVEQLEGMGINLDNLAPNAEEGVDVFKCGGRVGKGHKCGGKVKTQHRAEGGEISDDEEELAELDEKYEKRVKRLRKRGHVLSPKRFRTSNRYREEYDAITGRINEGEEAKRKSNIRASKGTEMPQALKQIDQNLDRNAADPARWDENTEALYEALIADNYDMADIDSFREGIKDPAKVQRLYETLIADNYDVGSLNDFGRQVSKEWKDIPEGKGSKNNREFNKALSDMSRHQAGRQNKAEGGEVISPKNDNWEYRRNEDGTIQTKKKGTDKWITPKEGSAALKEIKKRHFPDVEKTDTPLDLTRRTEVPRPDESPVDAIKPLGPPTAKQAAKQAFVEENVGKFSVSPEENAALDALEAEEDKTKEPPPGGFKAEDALPYIGVAQAVGGIAGIAAAGSVSPLTVSDDLNSVVAQTQEDAQYGFEPAQKAAQERKIQQNLHNALNAISSTGGGGPASSYNKTVNAMNQSNEAVIQSDIADANLKQQKQGVANATKLRRGERKDFIQGVEFKDVRDMQGGMAEVFSAGLDNITGAIQYKQYLTEKRKRDALLGNTLPS